MHAGKFSQAIPELEKALPLASSLLGYAYAKNGERGKAWAIVAELNNKSSREYVSPLAIAIVYVGLDDKQRAMDGLESTRAFPVVYWREWDADAFERSLQ